MTEQELRLIVREAIARHLGHPLPPSPAATPIPHRTGPEASCGPVARPWKTHPSHARIALPTGRDEDGPCLVEPEVKCTHCAFCQSYGH